MALTGAGKQWIVLLGLCLGSRLLSAVHYIEDPDSLRFALSLVDYDVSRLQPHFPAYPVFCLLAKLLYWLTGRYALAFALVGGIATFGLIYWVLAIVRAPLLSILGIALSAVLFFNPMVWLMGNRYMPDLLGLACLAASFHCLTDEKGSSCRIAWGFGLAGLLLGLRLSYAPLLLPPLLWVLARTESRARLLAIALAATALWLLPLIAITGWDALIASAMVQSQGHFTKFGGTLATEPDLSLRLVRLARSIWSDAFGLYWSGRHWSTGAATLGLAGLLLTCGRGLKLPQDSRLVFRLAVGSFLVYLGWIFFSQNIVYKSRHVLPLVPLLAPGLAVLCRHAAAGNGRLARLFLVLFAVSSIAVTLNLVDQHQGPTAIAQVHRFLAEDPDEKRRIVAVPLISHYLRSQAIEAEYLPVESAADLEGLEQLAGGNLFSIGSPLPGLQPHSARTFYHNPHVNRMWPEITLYEY